MIRTKYMLLEVATLAGAVRRLKFAPVFDMSISEGQRFQRSAPVAGLPAEVFEVTVDNDDAWTQFEIGKNYFFDISPVGAADLLRDKARGPANTGSGTVQA